MTIEAAMQLAVQHHSAGELAEAEQLYRLVLASQPKSSRCAASARASWPAARGSWKTAFA